jgi:transposase
MPGRSYDRETRAKAVRLVGDHVGDYATEWAAIKAVSGRLGMSAETLRKGAVASRAVRAAESLKSRLVRSP